MRKELLDELMIISEEEKKYKSGQRYGGTKVCMRKIT